MHRFASLGVLCSVLLLAPACAQAQDGVTRYVRYQVDGRTAHGILDGETVRELDGPYFDDPAETGTTHPLDGVELLAPVEPSKVVAVGLNYESHLGGREAADEPGLFAKYPTSIVGPEEEIVMPDDSDDLHYEGEMVLVIGRRARNVAPEDVPDHVFGVTAGNDVSERGWQDQDLQWLRAKASDTFGPIGPAIARGVDYDALQLTTRVNGEVRQSENTSDLIFDVAAMVSYISRYVTLMPGDVIFTGTPGTTRAMEVGDVVEVELEGAGVLRNRAVGAGR